MAFMPWEDMLKLNEDLIRKVATSQIEWLIQLFGWISRLESILCTCNSLELLGFALTIWHGSHRGKHLRGAGMVKGEWGAHLRQKEKRVDYERGLPNSFF